MLCLSDYRGDGGRNVIPSTLWTMTEVLAVLVAEDRILIAATRLISRFAVRVTASFIFVTSSLLKSTVDRLHTLATFFNTLFYFCLYIYIYHIHISLFLSISPSLILSINV